MDASKVLKKHAFLRIDILTVRLYRSLMADESLGIKVERKNGERFRRALVDLKAFDPGRKICSDGSQIYLPVRELSEKEAEKLRLVADYDVVNFGFVPEEKILTPEDILGFRPSFEIVGDIAMIEDLEEGEAERVASALMSSSNSIKTVIAPISDVEGEYRTRRYRHVAGEERTTTTHKEHGLRYR
ncbi:MAG: class I SAM-dependent methyltransferase family protein, partial [Methanothrix soehngenii]|nr:class I SAM-dependent methyltransferase family protein [Methanothrix soehngenii]